MIYLKNTTEPQEIFIARQSLQVETTRTIDLSNYPQRDEVEGMIDSALTEYSTTDEVNQMIDSAMAAETARTESTYLKEHQSLSAYSTTVEVEGMIEQAISGIDLSDYYTKEETDSALSAITEHIDDVEQVTSRALNELRTDIDNIVIPDVSEFVTSADVKTQIESYDYANKTYVDNKTNGLFAGVSYDSSAKTITFTDKQDNQVGQIDATDFIKDGMVENVYISGETMYIVFNTDSGKETIELNIGDIFDADNYYTKSEVNGLFASETARTESTYLKEHQSLSAYSTTVETQQMIDNSVSGKQDTITDLETIRSGAALGATALQPSALSAYSTTVEVEGMIQEAVSGIDLSNYYTIDETDSAITEAIETVENRIDDVEQVTSIALNELHTELENTVSGKQDTLVSGTNIKTINNQSLLGSGNITIQGGGGSGGTNVIDITKAEYEALSAYTEGAIYNITDAETVDLNDFAQVSDLEALETTVSGLSETKADKVNVSAKTSGYQFPNWNNQGVITGNYSTWYSASKNTNGSSRNILSSSSSSFPATYAPTTVGTKGQMCLSNGSGAPVWSTYKVEFISQSAYDALTTKDATTIYYIISED